MTLFSVKRFEHPNEAIEALVNALTDALMNARFNEKETRSHETR